MRVSFIWCSWEMPGSLIRARHTRAARKSRPRHRLAIGVYIIAHKYVYDMRYLGIEVAALLHESADGEPEAVGQSEVVDVVGQSDVLGVGVQRADVTALYSGSRGGPAK